MIIIGKPLVKSPSLFASVKGIDVHGKSVLYFPANQDIKVEGNPELYETYSIGILNIASVKTFKLEVYQELYETYSIGIRDNESPFFNNEYEFKARLFSVPSKTHKGRLDYIIQSISQDVRDIKLPEVSRVTII